MHKTRHPSAPRRSALRVAALLVVLGAAVAALTWWQTRDPGWIALVSDEAPLPGQTPEQCTVRLADRTESVSAYFGTLDYTLDGLRAGGGAVPRVYMEGLPSDLAELRDAGERKRLFVRAVLPLVLKENERLLRLRDRLRALQAGALRGDRISPTERRWLVETFDLYNVEPGDWPLLLRRVDAVPPSIALAQAVMESGWGQSRFVQQGNSLFGQWTWKGADPGIVPGARAPDAEHRVRAFANLNEAVRSYVHNLNSHWAYREFREARARARREGQPLDGLSLARGLVRYSERGAQYVAEVRRLIRENRFHLLDSAALAAHAVDCQAPTSSTAGMKIVLVAYGDGR